MYREFSKTMEVADIRIIATNITAGSEFDGYRDSILNNVQKELTESSKMLIFTYKCLLAMLRSDGLMRKE